ncbi:MAG: histidine kinase [Actinomycetota bacterium]
MSMLEEEQRRARRIADAMIAVMVIALASDVGLKLVDKGFSDTNTGDLFFVPLSAIGVALYATIGRLIVGRQPRNTIGWLLLAIPLVSTVAIANGSYATHALVIHPGSVPFGVLSAWVDRWAIVGVLFLFIPIFLLFPEGRLPSPRWRWVLVATIVAPVVTVLAFAFTPGRLTGAFADLTSVRVANPVGISAAGGPISALTAIGGLATFGTAILAGVAIVVRFRRAASEERQQIRWLLYVGVAFFVFLFLATALGDRWQFVSNALFSLTFTTLIVGIPLACGIAVLRYHLYDLDVVVKKTVVFGLLAAFVTAVYALVVGGVGALVGALVGATSNTVLSFLAAALLAVAFQPVRDRITRLADRLVYGKRATPYEVVAEFSDRMAETYATEDVLPRMAEILGDGTGAGSARVWLRVGKELRPVAAAGDADAAVPIRLAGDGLPPVENEYAVEVRHQGELLGALSVEMPASDPMNPAKGRLIEDLAAQAGLVLHNVRLIEELRASRQRLVAAQDEERRKLERNLHDGAQQQLVALAVKLRLAEQLADRDAKKTRELVSSLQAETQDALENLRDLARGIYPPLLADKGLGAALEGQARKASIPVEISTDGTGRYPQEVEAAVYFCCLEALQNVQKYADASAARISLEQSDDVLRFEVTDDGAGFDPAATGYGTGLQGMADRLDAIGGTPEVRSETGRGTTIIGSVPTTVARTDEDAPTSALRDEPVGAVT